MNYARIQQNRHRRYLGTCSYQFAIRSHARTRAMAGKRKVGTTSAYVPTTEKVATTGPATAPGREGKGTT